MTRPQSQPRSATTTTGSRRKRALIVGAGPVGSLTALSLDKRGWEVEVWEGRTGESCRGWFSLLFLEFSLGGGRRRLLALFLLGVFLLCGGREGEGGENGEIGKRRIERELMRRAGVADDLFFVFIPVSLSCHSIESTLGSNLERAYRPNPDIRL